MFSWISSPLKKEIMLNTSTKKRIDDCRDILVGKLPDPKAQIEQITIALIYKFMDDMDKEAVELGGKPKFFADYTIPDPENPKKKKKIEFEKFAWDNLFDPKVSAAQMLALYAEAITLMDKNPNIPQLFRDIFKNAFLPYRDPETLKLFLKEIGKFEYTHSEKLGDAFEYLLAVMGSQGDAGQFRTPRHIIDFLVSIVDPDIMDTILDPACGTAGFLISAYKHIRLKHSKSNKDKLNIYQFDNNYADTEKPFNDLGDSLTPDNRKRLIKNISGYDISPDMVRLSLVNLYLHGFSDPHIHEYDTLSSEERWDEHYDVILANPPFMSPKGGIRPHNKFSISSNRSEVLFVDYIAEHLNPKGRAGIIVPEGIIFQSGTAYKALRKMLVENHLYAVVSLPAGVFNPYSGVKTSILLMDKEFAKKSEEILFVKIENDGYNLGAQRNAVKGSQLEEAIEIIKSFRDGSYANAESEHSGSIAHAVPKAEIAKNGDYNLSGERYKSNNTLSIKYESVKLGDVCRILNGRAYKQGELLDSGKYPVLRVGNFFSNRGWYYSDLELEADKYCSKGDLLYAWSASFGPKIWDGEKCIYHYHIWKMEPDESRINKYYLYHILNRETDSIKMDGGRGIAMIHITKYGIEQREIPLPPLSVQQEIVAEIEGYQKIIDGAKMVVENYKPRIDIDPSWEMVELSTICDVRDGTHDSPKYNENGYPLITSKNIKEGGIDFENVNFISKNDFEEINKRSLVDDGDIIMPMIGTIGNPIVVKKDREFAIKNVALIKFLPDSKIDRYYLKNILDSDYFNHYYQQQASGSTQKFISLGFIRSIKVPLPTLDFQHQIVAQIDKEQELINANKQLIDLFEKKIKDRIAKVWGE